MIKLRIDVDYPYPSRLRSFLYTALGIGTSKGYLKNSKIVARMINESSEKVKAYWFFTPTTVPDKELLALLNNERHEVALHIVNDPYGELKNLEDLTGRKIGYYTIHGTARLFARLMWKRWTTISPKIPPEFPLTSFYQFPTIHLDVICYSTPTDKAVKIAQKAIREGQVLHFHPIWLFQRGRINYRGPYFDTLRRVLEVGSEFDTLSIRKKLFFTIAHDTKEYEMDVRPREEFFDILRARGIDIFTFVERGWCRAVHNPPGTWVKARDNVALLQVTSYDDWLRKVGKKVRNMIRKAEKNGISVSIAEPDERLVEGIWKMYNETPIRQERGFPHYGVALNQVSKELRSAQNFTYIGAYLQDELVGFIQLVDGENIEIISQILSLQKHWDKAVNNALVAKAVENCASRGAKWIMYGRMGNHPSLDNFKQSNGFTQFQLTRYYIPLTRRGKTATKFGMHKEIKDSLPRAIKYPLFRLYNWTSRTRTKVKLRFRREKAI